MYRTIKLGHSNAYTCAINWFRLFCWRDSIIPCSLPDIWALRRLKLKWVRCQFEIWLVEFLTKTNILMIAISPKYTANIRTHTLLPRYEHTDWCYYAFRLLQTLLMLNILNTIAEHRMKNIPPYSFNPIVLYSPFLGTYYRLGIMICRCHYITSWGSFIGDLACVFPKRHRRLVKVVNIM